RLFSSCLSVGLRVRPFRRSIPDKIERKKPAARSGCRLKKHVPTAEGGVGSARAGASRLELIAQAECCLVCPFEAAEQGLVRVAHVAIQEGVKAVQFPLAREVVLHTRLDQNRAARIVESGKANPDDVLRKRLLEREHHIVRAATHTRWGGCVRATISPKRAAEEVVTGAVHVLQYEV